MTEPLSEILLAERGPWLCADTNDELKNKKKNKNTILVSITTLKRIYLRSSFSFIALLEVKSQVHFFPIQQTHYLASALIFQPVIFEFQDHKA